jgi:hypothetical protein
MIQARNLGLPRMGAKRELKLLLRTFWSGKIGEIVVEQTALNCAKPIEIASRLWHQCAHRMIFPLRSGSRHCFYVSDSRPIPIY